MKCFSRGKAHTRAQVERMVTRIDEAARRHAELHQSGNRKAQMLWVETTRSRDIVFQRLNSCSFHMSVVGMIKHLAFVGNTFCSS